MFFGGFWSKAPFEGCPESYVAVTGGGFSLRFIGVQRLMVVGPVLVRQQSDEGFQGGGGLELTCPCGRL